MITEDYVSFEIAKLLREKGFRHWCRKSYGTAVYHKGAPISFDEECELESDGLGAEIEYVEGGCLYDLGCDNRKDDAKAWAAPTLYGAMKWLRMFYKLCIVVKPYVTEEGIFYLFEIKEMNKDSVINKKTKTGFDFHEQACEAAIKYCLENLI